MVGMASELSSDETEIGLSKKPEKLSSSGGDGVGESGEGEFAVELLTMLQPLRKALKGMLSEWGSPATLGTLHRMSGAGRTICWQVFRIVQAEDLAAEARHAPTPASLKRLLAAARGGGVSQETVDEVNRCAEAFRQFTKGHARDRAAFESLVVGAAQEAGGGEQILVAQRRAAYRAMSHIWGIQTDFGGTVTMVRRPETGEGLDMAQLLLHRGVRRLRPDSVMSLGGRHVNASGTTKGERTAMEAFDPEAEKVYGVPIVPQFCTAPLPEIERVELPTGWVWYNMAGRSVGMQSTQEWTYGGITRNAPLMEDEGGRKLFHSTMVSNRKPLAHWVADLLVHRPTLGGVKPELMVYQHTEGDYSQATARRAQQFAIGERLVRVGSAARLEMVEYPRYQELTEYLASKTGWLLEEFDVYRFRMPYPIFGSAMRVYFYV